MKILLKNNEADELKFCDIGLGYLAAPLIKRGHDVHLLLEELNSDEFTALLKKFTPDIIGIKILTPGVPKTIATIELVRSVLPDCIVVIGGPHVTGLPEQSLKDIPADYGFQGEADNSFAMFVDSIHRGEIDQKREQIPGLIWKLSTVIRCNPPDQIVKLDELPFPTWHLMPPRQHQSLVSRRSPAAPLMVTRGCTDSCTFCVEGTRRLRFRSVENVVAEIRLLVEEFGVGEIQFLDSNFVFSKSYIVELCKAIIDAKLDISVCAPNGTRLEAIDDEVAALLARIGFYRANIGVESGSDVILQGVRKRLNLDILHEKVDLLNRYGIQVIGNFMLGFPHETREQMQQTLDLALSLNLTGANFAIYTPLPGTPLYDEMNRSGKLSGINGFNGYNFVTYENRLSALTPQELRQFRAQCVFRFLFRWKTVVNLATILQDSNIRNSLIKRLYGMYIQKLFSK